MKYASTFQLIGESNLKLLDELGRFRLYTFLRNAVYGVQHLYIVRISSFVIRNSNTEYNY